jgi:hypothetical protein
LRGTWRAFVEWLFTLLTPVGQAITRLWKRTVGLQWRRLRFECQQIAYDYRLGRERVAVAAEEGRRGLMILLAILVPFMTLRRHRRFFHVIFQGVMVTASALILVGVIRYWENTTFALELVYGGRSIGYITDESVFNEAVDMAEGRIIKNADGYVIERESYLTLRPVQQSRVLSKSQLCDEILKLSGSNVAQMSGLYVDGVFEGALLSREQMEMLLETIEQEYAEGNYVIAGGDFNMDLLDNSGFIFGVSGADYSWAQPFPKDMLPDYLTLYAPYDPMFPVPSCRNADSPWNPETNFQITIDGFLITDNIEVENCEVTDQQFAYSDHQMVQLMFKFK